MRLPERISINPSVCHGQPVVQGTRTPVAVILDHVNGGEPLQSICHNYDLTEADILACIEFAAAVSPPTQFPE